MARTSPGVTQEFSFPRADVENHPCYIAARKENRRWTIGQVVLVSIAVATCALANMRLIAGIGAPLGLLMAGAGIANLMQNRQLRRLRERGMLRDLVLAGQSPILTILAVQVGCHGFWFVPFFAFGLGSCTTLLMGTNMLADRYVATGLGLFAATALSVGLSGFKGVRTDCISRENILEIIGKRRLIARVGYGFFSLLFVVSLLTVHDYVIVFLVLGAPGALFLKLSWPWENRILSVPDAEFAAWVEQWCLGSTTP